MITNMFEPLIRLVSVRMRSLSTPVCAPGENMRRLAAILKVDVGELDSIRLGTRFHYRPIAVAKPDGRTRRLLAPSPALKMLQRRLLDNYLAAIPTHECGTAFRAGSSTVRNALAHARQSVIATVDLRDFFESTHARRVRAFFVKEGWRDRELATLMRLCAFRNGLPQGAPTSPCLSNLVNVSLDERLKRLAQKAGAIYTRYGDDLTFSWTGEHATNDFFRAAEEALHAAGYEIQPRKGWRICPISDRPCVTGIVLCGNGRIRVPWDFRWRIWALRWRSWWSADSDTRARLQGCRAYLRMVNKGTTESGSKHFPKHFRQF